MKMTQKTPQWIVAKRARKKAKRQGKKTIKAHAGHQIAWSR